MQSHKLDRQKISSSSNITMSTHIPHRQDSCKQILLMTKSQMIKSQMTKSQMKRNQRTRRITSQKLMIQRMRRSQMIRNLWSLHQDHLPHQLLQLHNQDQMPLMSENRGLNQHQHLKWLTLKLLRIFDYSKKKIEKLELEKI